jgi:hypothetical protein
MLAPAGVATASVTDCAEVNVLAATLKVGLDTGNVQTAVATALSDHALT